MTRRLEGKPVADKIYKRISELIDHNLERKGRPPHLVIFYAQDNEESCIYVGKKVQACEKHGIKCTTIALSYAAPYHAIREMVYAEGRKRDVDGIIIQLPLLPVSHWQIQELIDCIHPDKDVDGLTTSSAGYLYKGKRIMWRIPATAKAVMAILQHYDIQTEGRRVVILGRSELVGKPLAHILSASEYDATVTLCHSKTKWNHRVKLLRNADIVISAVGKPHFIKSSNASNACIIDAGISKTPEGIKGDVEWDYGYLRTPVPGGVGPVTVACLLENVVLRWSYTDEALY